MIVGKLSAAILVDADDMPREALNDVYSAFSSGCDIRVFRVFGNSAKLSDSGWTALSARLPLDFRMTPNNSPGKSSASLALALDAMDLLFTHQIDTFCLCSEGSDFSRLARKLRGYGKQVIGIGESSSCHAFRASCGSFLNLSDIAKDKGARLKSLIGVQSSGACRDTEEHHEQCSQGSSGPEPGSSGQSGKEAAPGSRTEPGNRAMQQTPAMLAVPAPCSVPGPKVTETKKSSGSEVKGVQPVPPKASASGGTQSQEKPNAIGGDGLDRIVYKAFLAISAKNGKVCLAQMVLPVRAAIPGFSLSKYGFSKFKKFLESFSFLEVRDQDVILKQSPAGAGSAKTQSLAVSGIGKLIRSVYQQLCSSQGSSAITTSDLCNALVKAKPGFSSKQYGCPNFQALLKSLGFVKVIPQKGKPPLVRIEGC